MTNARRCIFTASPEAGEALPAHTVRSPELEKATEDYNAAFRAYAKVRDAYRAQKIGDAEFLVAASRLNIATASYDAVYAAQPACDCEVCTCA